MHLLPKQKKKIGALQIKILDIECQLPKIIKNLKIILVTIYIIYILFQVDL